MLLQPVLCHIVRLGDHVRSRHDRRVHVAPVIARRIAPRREQQVRRQLRIPFDDELLQPQRPQQLRDPVRAEAPVVLVVPVDRRPQRHRSDEHAALAQHAPHRRHRLPRRVAVLQHVEAQHRPDRAVRDRRQVAHVADVVRRGRALVRLHVLRQEARVPPPGERRPVKLHVPAHPRLHHRLRQPLPVEQKAQKVLLREPHAALLRSPLSGFLAVTLSTPLFPST